MGREAKDITGQKFGYWTVINRSPKEGKTAYWWCKCDCGTFREVAGSMLRSGDSKSCGCGIHENKGRFQKDSQHRRKYKINHNFFKNIDTEEKAYWLGFIAADGNVRSVVTDKIHRYTLSITLRESDRHHLEKFRDVLYRGDKPKITKNRSGCVLEVSSKQNYYNLVNAGICDRKSLTLTFPTIQNALLKHFIRGYFDGDGWISVANKHRCLDIGMLGTEEFLSTTQDILLEKLSISKVTIRKDKKDGNVSVYHKTGNDAKAICDWLYKDANIYLYRKKKLYDSIKIIKYQYLNHGQKNRVILDNRINA